jgi:homoserine kinase
MRIADRPWPRFVRGAPANSGAPRRARVRVPGSSSNLGAGFDCLGIALARYITAEFEPDDGTALTAPALRVERRGTLRALDGGPDDRDLIVRAFRRYLESLGVSVPGGALILDSEIPIARGFGSSAAAVVTGMALAAAVADVPLEHAQALRIAREFEDHLDNVAPSILGGLVAVTVGDDGVPHAFRLPLSDKVGFAFAAPGAELETRRARAALPKTVTHGDAVHNIGAMAALVRALETGDADLMRLGLSDRLHVQYRLPLIPGAVDALRAALSAGAWGATVSGAGSGLLALAAPDRIFDVADAMAAAFRMVSPTGVVFFAAEPDARGATVE